MLRGLAMLGCGRPAILKPVGKPKTAGKCFGLVAHLPFRTRAGPDGVGNQSATVACRTDEGPFAAIKVRFDADSLSFLGLKR